MRILGITLGHDTSFSLVVDGSVAGVVEAERYFRRKRYKLHCVTLEEGKHPGGYQYLDINELRMFLELIGKSWGKDFDAIGVQNQGRTGEFNNLIVLLREAGYTFKKIHYYLEHILYWLGDCFTDFC